MTGSFEGEFYGGGIPSRPDPKPCRESDIGRFEVVSRTGRARLGKLHTNHGTLDTPTLLPVVNPNILTIPPREMYDRFGVNGLITNSYVIWKGEENRSRALEEGVHSLLDFPGVVVTDSGTFQSYVYGDVEVEPVEIVEFQRNIGVDVATMLDVFGRPDMKREELENAVSETAARADASLDAAGDMMLNGPVQGGLELDLRRESAKLMGNHAFSIHPIGGIVPLMEQRRYTELAKVVLASKPNLPNGRPVHLFGLGHPSLFPFAMILGADLFDSAAYALFARDDRLLTPTGTLHLSEITEWPFISSILSPYTPQEVKRMKQVERTRLLARYNLEVTMAELALCREAIRKGTIWELAEQRSHSSPALREAFEWLIANPVGGECESDANIPVDADWERAGDWLLAGEAPLRSGPLEWTGSDWMQRPRIQSARKILHDRWSPPPVTHTGELFAKNSEILVFHGFKPPYRETAGESILAVLNTNPQSLPFIWTPIGLLPYSLEDVTPWAHIEVPNWYWNRPISRECVGLELASFGLSKRPHRLISSDSKASGETVNGDMKGVKSWLELCQVSDKLALYANIPVTSGFDLLAGGRMVKSRTKRVINAIDGEGRHICSPRLTDGGLSLTDVGAKILAELSLLNDGSGLPCVEAINDAIPFVRDGKSLFHGFISSVSPAVRQGLPCLVKDVDGNVVAHGLALAPSDSMVSECKGMAVKIKGGFA